MTWRLLALVALVAFLLGALLGWRLRGAPPEPRVEVRETVKTEVQWRDRVQEREVAGPTTTIERWRTVLVAASSTAPGCPPPAPVVCEEHEKTTTTGPVTRTREETASRASTSTADESLVVVPQVVARPGWAVSAGLQLLPDRRLEVGLERRLLGPVWVRAWALQPAKLAVPALGAGLRTEF